MTLLMLKRMADGRWVLVKEGVTVPVREFQILTPHRLIGFGEAPHPTMAPQRPPHAHEAQLTDDSDPEGFKDFPKDWQNVSGDWV